MTKIVLCFYYNRMKCTDDDKCKKPYRNALYFGATEKLKHCKYLFFKLVAKLHFFRLLNGRDVVFCKSTIGYLIL